MNSHIFVTEVLLMPKATFQHFLLFYSFWEVGPKSSKNLESRRKKVLEFK